MVIFYVNKNHQNLENLENVQIVFQLEIHKSFSFHLTLEMLIEDFSQTAFYFKKSLPENDAI